MPSEPPYRVWKLRFHLAMQDPDTTGIRYHTSIFVETGGADDHADGAGTGAGRGVVFHVVGDVTAGMTYETKHTDPPEETENFYAKTLLGHAAAGTFPTQWNLLLRGIPPPGKQKAFNPATMRTEPVKSWGRDGDWGHSEPAFYAPSEQRPPLFKCTEWTEQRALPALVAAGLLVPCNTEEVTVCA
ncbi:hypothetical protein SPI_02082 [Niveomyces insectorum RCEF 264]|uniref:Uncharacterized protein n=1 Tax=Niveomyces insectorum RCEF 264 TaxID=1081102 RepID=A0A167XRF3_9HYPO|nr:hypothetical protein SPI_02082 [Niveomyces insectorum RCEF 264]